MRCHVFGTVSRAAAEYDRTGGAFQFRDRHHHGRFDRGQAVFRLLPLVNALELQRLGRKIGNVEARQQFLRGPGVVVGRSAHQREAGQ